MKKATKNKSVRQEEAKHNKWEIQTHRSEINLRLHCT